MGTIADRHRIERSLGKGGIGEAFLAREVATDRRVVVKKVPKTALAQKIESLRHEFATLSRLAHPNIARVFEFGEDGESVFFLEEYVDGTDVFQALHGADYNRILAAFVQILRALQYLHREGFLHGDLKPENILTVRGASVLQGDSVKIIDFGLARHVTAGKAEGRPAGTLHFLAPEILLDRPYDTRADFYSLGVCLYRMIAGRYPFENDRGRIDLLIRDQIEKTPVEPSRLRADLPRGLNELTMRLLAKSPEGRFWEASEILKALNEIEGERFPLWTREEIRVALERPLERPDDLKDRLRLKSIPPGWNALLERSAKDGLQSAVELADFWLQTGVVRVQGDVCEFTRDASAGETDLEAVFDRRLKGLEADKRRLLFLCAEARIPLSLEILHGIIEGPEGRTDQLVLEMEEEGWLERFLHNGVHHYRADRGFARRILESQGPRTLSHDTVDGLLKLADQAYRSGRLREARRVLEGLGGRLNASDPDSRDVWVRYLTVASLVSLEEGDLETAEDLSRRFLKVERLTDAERGKIWGRLGWIAYRRGAYKDALQAFESSAAHWEKDGDPVGRASIANLQGMTHQALGDWTATAKAYGRALEIVLPSEPLYAVVQMNLAIAAQAFEDYGRAVAAYEAARKVSESSNNFNFRGRLLNNLANLYLYLGRLDEAARQAHGSLKIAVEHGLTSLEGNNYLLLSVVADREGRVDACGDFLEKAGQVFQSSGTSAEKATARLHQAYHAYTSGDDAAALAALAGLREGFPAETAILAHADLLLSKIAARNPEKSPEGVAAARRAVGFFEARKDDANLWDAWYALGKLQAGEEARASFQRALDVLEKLAAKIPEECRNGFFRDRKRERILFELSSLKDNLQPKQGRPPMTQKTQGPQTALSEMARINRLLASEHNLTYLLETILEESLELLEGERGFILLLEDGEFRIKAARNMDRKALEEDASEAARYSTTIARQSVTAKGSILVADAQTDDRFHSAASVVELGIRAAVAVPMKIGPEVAGVVYVDNRFHSGKFDEGHQKMLETFADQAALALKNARQMEEIRRRGKDLEASQKQIQDLNDLLKRRLDVTEQEYAATRERYQLQQGEIQLRYAYDQIVGKSSRLRDVLKTLDRVTESDVTVLIQGESGTGKELIARALHYNGPRKGAPFVAENCASFSEQLLESELFGHKKGSFTGAISDKQGLFEVAHGGTIFLDEIGELSPAMQSKLLRVLQERQFRPVGGNEYRKVDVRIIAATNKDLKAMIKEGKFREDLYYRINVVKVVSPPLRDRKEDIPLLIDHFLKKNEEEAGAKIKMHPKAMALLMRYDWPGNIRELSNELQRCFAMGMKTIEPESLSEKVREEFTLGPKVSSLDSQVSSLEKNVIVETLKKYQYSRLKTAKALGVSRITLYKKMKSYGILAKKSDYARVNA